MSMAHEIARRRNHSTKPPTQAVEQQYAEAFARVLCMAREVAIRAGHARREGGDEFLSSLVTFDLNMEEEIHRITGKRYAIPPMLPRTPSQVARHP